MRPSGRCVRRPGYSRSWVWPDLDSVDGYLRGLEERGQEAGRRPRCPRCAEPAERDEATGGWWCPGCGEAVQ